MSENGVRKTVIIGSGPAGLTAAIYTARATLEPLVIDGLLPGGQLTQTSELENFPGFEHGIDGNQFMDTIRKQAARFGAEYMHGEVTDIDTSSRPFKVIVNGKDEVLTESVIIASGARARRLDLESETKFFGRGVSTCATCDGFFYKGRKVAVVGGGDSAMEEATFLTKFADKVYLIHRREEFRASKIMVQRAEKNEKIEFVLNAVPEEILGDDNGVTGVRIKNTQNGETQDLAVDGFFLAIGHIPNTDYVKGKVQMNDEGYIGVRDLGETMTDVEGIFVAGDVHDEKYRQAITAAGMGCRAAIEVERWLEAQED